MPNCHFRFDTTYTSLPRLFYTQLRPERAPHPRTIIVNEALAESLGLDFSDLTEKEKTALFSGNDLPEGSTPFAQAYAGHQFGHFTLLGDGRAHILGEHITPTGDRFDIQFKGSGRTPYSRQGDGKAVLGPMLREYVISEAMHHLGIPTTRSLAVATTGELVFRGTMLPGALLTRVASSHIRIGSFEFAAKFGDKEAMESLTAYTLQRHYPECIGSPNEPLALIKRVMDKQIDLIVDWMRVGFIHGVMNTDNMTLSGETIDYGPCAFMDTYHTRAVFSSIDRSGRYAFANQPKMAQWNLARFAETLLPAIDDDLEKAVDLAKGTLNQFSDLFQKKWLSMMRSKLGLLGSQIEDQTLVSDLLEWMEANRADYTNTFCDLANPVMPRGRLFETKSFKEWHSRWQARIQKNPKSSQSSFSLMGMTNPAVIPRNHKVEQALDAANDGDFEPFETLCAALKEPYKNREQLIPYQRPPGPGESVTQTFCGT